MHKKVFAVNLFYFKKRTFQYATCKSYYNLEKSLYFKLINGISWRTIHGLCRLSKYRLYQLEKRLLSFDEFDTNCYRSTASSSSFFFYSCSNDVDVIFLWLFMHQLLIKCYLKFWLIKRRIFKVKLYCIGLSLVHLSKAA